jgi:hypothetical protein
MIPGIDGMFKAIAETPPDVMREGRVQDHARRLMQSLAANPKALERSCADVANIAFKLAEAFDDLSQARYSQSRGK